MTDTDKTPEQAKLDEILDKLAAINERLDRIELARAQLDAPPTIGGRPLLDRIQRAGLAALEAFKLEPGQSQVKAFGPGYENF